MSGRHHRALPATGPLCGTLAVPGDKSISHRAVLFAAMAEGTSHLTGVLDAADVRSTIVAVRELGAQVVESGSSASGLTLEVTGWGARGPAAHPEPIDCGNSGTTCRLLMGVLAGWPGRFVLTGDESLSRRPMRRVAEPLAGMGARIALSDAGTLPAVIDGGALKAADHDLTVASAQVKTALLLAGLRCAGRTAVREPAPSRDHTERLLPAFSIPVGRSEQRHEAWVDGTAVPLACDVAVPGDPSSAAFLVGAALLVTGSEVTITGIALNPTRTGFLRVLERMGADVSVRPRLSQGAEPVGDVVVRWTPGLCGTTVTPEEVPSLVDEVPLLAVVAASAATPVRFEGVGELRVKESDRLQALADALAAFGVPSEAGTDCLVVCGPAVPGPASLDSLGDHRLAMAYTVAALGGSGPVEVERFDAVAVSYPGFEAALRSLGAP